MPLKNSNKGFTLVELLIVIVIIGILAAMMMFSSAEATNEAKAIKIINDLQMLKRAALSYRADNYDEIISNIYLDIQNKKDEIIKYAKNTPELFEGKDYFFRMVRFNNVEGSVGWFVGYHGAELEKNMTLRRKLAARAKSQGLYNGFVKEYPQQTYNESASKFFEENIFTVEWGKYGSGVGLRII